MDDNYERHGSDELASAGKATEKGIEKGVDLGKGVYHTGEALHDKYKEHKDNQNRQNGSSLNGEGGSGSNARKNRNNQQAEAQRNQNRAPGKQDANGGKGAKTPFGKKNGKGIGGNLLNKGKNPTGNSANKTQNFVSKLLPNITGRRKSMFRRILKLMRKTVRAVILFFAFFPLIVIICLVVFPTLFLRSMAYEIIETGVEYLMEFTYNFFNIGNGEDLTDEQKRELYKQAAEDFISDVADKGYWILDQLSSGAHTFFQFCDDITDDDTPFGSFCNDMSNYFYKNHVEYEMYQKQKGDHLDSASLMQVMVIDELRSGYSDITYLDLNTMLGLEWQKATELKDYYCTIDPDFENDFGIGPKEMIFYLEPPFRKSGLSSEFLGGDKLAGFSDIESETYIPTHNIPIVISNEDHYVYLQGNTEPEGYIDDQGVQHLRDCIMYNPYGNTRSSLNVSTGSDYEMKSMAAYLICVYSACTPYDKQSIADLVTKIHEGMHDTDTKLVKYNVDFTNVYYGSIVPRLYQPYLYTDENGYVTGEAQSGYFEKNGTREIIGMTPLTDKAEIYPKGWVDVNGNAVFDTATEEFPICLQVISTDNTGRPFYSDSFTVISYDKTRTNMSYIPEKGTETARVNELEEALGYHVTGIDEKHKEKFGEMSAGYGYVDFDWEGDFKYQYEKQQRIGKSLSPNDKYTAKELQQKYIYRYEFPFTRISVGGFDSGGGLEDYKRVVKISGENASDGSYIGDMIYTVYNDGDHQEVRMNGGAINGFAAWAYVKNAPKFTISREDHKDYRQEDAEDGRVTGGTYAYRDLVYNDISIENWGEDMIFKDYEDVLLNQYGARPYVYNAKMRYMISVNVVAVPNYTDFIDKAFGYEPSAMLNRDLDENGNLAATGGRDVTQGELVNGSLKVYMKMLGIKEEVVTANNPQIGTERTYTYEEVIDYIRACKNQDGSVPDLNRKYMIFIAMAACGHVMYQFGGDASAGLHFEEWKTTLPGSDPSKYNIDSNGDWVMDGYVAAEYGGSKAWRENYGYEYIGLDCSGFMTWILRTAFDPSFPRLYSETILNIQMNDQNKEKTTQNVISGYGKATSSYGEVFSDDTKLKVGDIGVRRKYEKGKLSGHLAMYIGRNEDGTQNWVEMTRYSMNTTTPVAGARVFTTESYSKNRGALYVHMNMIPEEPVSWTLMNPQWMLIPTQSEISYYVSDDKDKKKGKGTIT